MKFRYTVISKNGIIVSCAYLQLVNFSGKNFSENGPRLLLPVLKLFFAVKKVRLLFCGNLFRVDFPCLHWLEQHISFDQALHIIQKIGDHEKSMLLMMKEMNLPPEKITVLEKNGFRKYEEDLTMALELNSSWKKFDDYFHSLTKKYRKRLVKIRNAKSPLIRKRLRRDEIQNLLPEIGKLFDQTASRQFLKMGLIDETYFTAMSDAFGDHFFINGYFLGDKLVAFASHLIHDKMLEVHYIGIDYALNEKYALYFNILYDGLEMAIDMKKKNLELGRTAREAKASVGCKPVPSYDYLFVRNRFIDFLVSIFENIFLDKMGDEWMNRNPFRMPLAKSTEPQRKHLTVL
jgi:predicted N-acyltransferase